MEAHLSFSESQSGFRPKHSTVTSLNFIYRKIGNRKAATAMYRDLAKAFDTVNHALLLENSGVME